MEINEDREKGKERKRERKVEIIKEKTMERKGRGFGKGRKDGLVPKSERYNQ